MIDLCKGWGLEYSDVWSWINKDKDRSEHYADALNARNEWAREAILGELRVIALADIRKLYNAKGELLPIQKWPPECAKFISSFEVDEMHEGRGGNRVSKGFVKRFKMWNKEKALELLGKNIAIFNEHHTVSGKLSLEDLINASIDGES